MVRCSAVFCPSVLRRCWLGHLTRKIVLEMTYNVSSGTLNPTIPCHALRCPQSVKNVLFIVRMIKLCQLFQPRSLIFVAGRVKNLEGLGTEVPQRCPGAEPRWWSRGKTEKQTLTVFAPMQCTTVHSDFLHVCVTHFNRKCCTLASCDCLSAKC